MDNNCRDASAGCTDESRHEQRYRCLGIGLFYSLNLHANLDKIGVDIFQAQIYDMSLNGLSIDVDDQYDTGEILQLCIEAPQGQREVLVAEVKWCKLTADNSYRVGLQINAYSGTSEVCAKSDQDGCYHHQKQAVPSEIRLFCPACEARVVFAYLGEQHGLPSNQKMSLYNCPACETTRSITTILQYNRKRIP